MIAVCDHEYILLWADDDVYECIRCFDLKSENALFSRPLKVSNRAMALPRPARRVRQLQLDLDDKTTTRVVKKKHSKRRRDRV